MVSSPMRCKTHIPYCGAQAFLTIGHYWALIGISQATVGYSGCTYPLTLELDKPKLPQKFWVKISQIRTLSVKRVRKKITEASEEEIALVIDGLNEIIGG
jgi:mRNA-degrading endonuclease toxin of MazEF toxin-antitoxin module